MSELTREYLDKQLNSQTKEIESYVDDRVSSVEKNLETKIETEVGRLETKIETEVGRLETKIETEVADLAGMVSRRFDKMEEKLDVRAEVDHLKSQMNKVWNALNIKN